MVKGGKQYSSLSNDGKWFAHPMFPENETGNRETCTTTGIMLTQAVSSFPQALNFQRYPKCKTQQDSRKYPFSAHDNKYIFKDDISVFTSGVGRRKCLDDHRQHNSHFCLCHDGTGSSRAAEARDNTTVYQRDFMPKRAVSGPTTARRFPHNHKQRSAEAALARAGEQFMWFGRHDSDLHETSRPLAASASSAPAKQGGTAAFKARVGGTEETQH